MSLDPILSAAHELQQFCASKQWQFCFIGGIAVQRWGEPRFTADADLTLLTGFGGEERYIDALSDKFRFRRADGREFALRSRVALLEAANGTPLDVALGAIPFEANSIRRASAFDVGDDRFLITCSGKLDLDLFRQEIEPLLEARDTPEVYDRFQRVYAKLKRRLA